ncbi:MAG: hypothetical protein WBO97_02000, partial [Tepidiformaceae bacterium]
MRRDLAMRGAILGFLSALGGGIAGFAEKNVGVGLAIWLLLLVASIGAIAGFAAFRRPAAALRTVADAAGGLG